MMYNCVCVQDVVTNVSSLREKLVRLEHWYQIGIKCNETSLLVNNYLCKSIYTAFYTNLYK